MSQTTQNELNFNHLAPYEKRQFVPEQADLTRLNEVVSLYNRLLSSKIQSSKELENWVLQRSELESAFDQQGTILYIRMTCQTDDETRVQSYKTFIETVVPQIKPLEDQLNKMFIKNVEQFPLAEDRYGLYIKEIKTDLELFVEQNIALETQVDLLSQEYQSICGKMTVDFNGKEHTLQEMHKYLLEPDRSLREQAWRVVAQRRLCDQVMLDELFNKMIKLRHQIALNAGFNNYCDYKFKSLHRFDYSPKDCFDYHDSVARSVVPLWTKILQKRKTSMNLEELRPWDTAVDVYGREPLRPFTHVDELISGCQKIFARVNAQFGSQFHQMVEDGLLDLSNRKGKAPGGYQSALNESRKPFIFMNTVGIDGDVRTLLHEGGHAFHSLACAHDPLLDYRHGPMEFNEVASMGMELLGGKFLDIFYNENDFRRSCIEHLEGILFTLIWVATIDAFQHWIYAHPSHTVKERQEEWCRIRARFSGGIVDWSGLEKEQAYLWHRQLHIFEVPFYYIEYGIAQLGALQLWQKSKDHFDRAVQQYQNALQLGGSRPLPELFEAAGLKFDFTRTTIEPLVRAVQAELDQLNDL